MFDALSTRVDWKHLLYILSLSRPMYLESYVGSRLNICLAMPSLVEVSDFISPVRCRCISDHSGLYLLSWK
jgi:hypothetical protein